VSPTYYGTIDTRADDPCNSAPEHRRNWSIDDQFGLDNDGDNRYDGNDPDCGSGCPGDLNNDGDTDLADLGILLAEFGNTCP
jgi:hypothetical protein